MKCSDATVVAKIDDRTAVTRLTRYRLATILSVVLALWLSSGARAETAASRPSATGRSAAIPVAFDWSGVPDGVVERCKLAGYRGVLTDRLVREGHAIVDRVDGAGIQLTVSATDQQITLEARYQDVTKKRNLLIPTPCERGLIIDLSHELVKTVRSTRAAAPAASPPKPRPPDPRASPSHAAPGPKPAARQAPPRPPARSPQRRFELKAGVASIFPGTLDALVGARVGATFSWRRLSVGVGASIDWHPGARLTVWEPGASLSLALALYRSDLLRLRAGLEGTLLHHGFDYQGQSGGKLDGRLGLLVELSLGRWVLLELLPYLRLDHTDHLIGNETIYESRHAGLLASLSWKIASF